VGWIVEAIVRVPADQQEPMQAKEVHATVGALLGKQVSWSLIQERSSVQCSGPSSRFVRLAK
jgi:hypothetical protein